MKVQISVIIPTCHRNDLLEKCLQKLAPGQQTLESIYYEVIVTDDGKVSTSEDLIQEKYPWVQWIKGPQKGPAANRNNGTKYAKGEWLVFTDDDCLPDANWLEAYRNAIIQHLEIKVFEGRTYADRERQRLDEEAPINETGEYLWSCNFAIERKLFESIGGFDEVFLYAAMEDVDLHYRLKNSGNDLKFVSEAAICHPWRRNKNIFGRCIRKEKSLKIYLKKHPQERSRLSFVYFIRAFIKAILNSYIPGMIRYKFKGFISEGIRIAYFIKFSFIAITLKLK